nr:MAG TPA: hypothetical protein [Caudoviricetes sp.]
MRVAAIQARVAGARFSCMGNSKRRFRAGKK